MILILTLLGFFARISSGQESCLTSPKCFTHLPQTLVEVPCQVTTRPPPVTSTKTFTDGEIYTVTIPPCGTDPGSVIIFEREATAATSVPDVTSNFPDVTTGFPDVTTNFPDVTTDFPDESTDFPDESTDFPDVTTVPDVTTFPDVTTVPDVTTDFPDVTTCENPTSEELTSEETSCEQPTTQQPTTQQPTTQEPTTTSPCESSEEPTSTSISTCACHFLNLASKEDFVLIPSAQAPTQLPLPVIPDPGKTRDQYEYPMDTWLVLPYVGDVKVFLNNRALKYNEKQRGFFIPAGTPSTALSYESSKAVGVKYMGDCGKYTPCIAKNVRPWTPLYLQRYLKNVSVDVSHYDCDLIVTVSDGWAITEQLAIWADAKKLGNTHGRVYLPDLFDPKHISGVNYGTGEQSFRRCVANNGFWASYKVPRETKKIYISVVVNDVVNWSVDYLGFRLDMPCRNNCVEESVTCPASSAKKQGMIADNAEGSKAKAGGKQVKQAVA